MGKYFIGLVALGFISMIIVGLVNLVGFAGFATISAGERGIIQSFGKVHDTLLQPGLNFYNPIIDQVRKVSVQQQTVNSEDTTSLAANPLTADQQPIKMTYSVMYRVPEAQVLNLFKNYRGDVFESLVAPKINEAVRQVVSQYRAEDITSKATEINSRVLTLARQKVGELVYISDIPITHFEMPPALQAAILDKQRMEIQAKKKQFELEKEKKEAEITVTRAEAEAKRIQLQQEALKQSPELIQYKLADVELEKAKRWNGQLPTTVVGSAANTLFKLN